MRRRTNPRQLTDRPRRSLSKWIEPRPPSAPAQTHASPGCWLLVASGVALIVLLAYLLLRWL